MQGQSGFSSPKRPARSSGGLALAIREEAARERIETPRTAALGRGRSLLIHRAHGRLAGGPRACDRAGHPFAFSPTRAAARSARRRPSFGSQQEGSWPGRPAGAEQKRAAGRAEAEVAGAGYQRQPMRVRAQLLFTSR